MRCSAWLSLLFDFGLLCDAFCGPKRTTLHLIMKYIETWLLCEWVKIRGHTAYNTHRTHGTTTEATGKGLYSTGSGGSRTEHWTLAARNHKLIRFKQLSSLFLCQPTPNHQFLLFDESDGGNFCLPMSCVASWWVAAAFKGDQFVWQWLKSQEADMIGCWRWLRWWFVVKVGEPGLEFELEFSSAGAQLGRVAEWRSSFEFVGV